MTETQRLAHFAVVHSTVPTAVLETVRQRFAAIVGLATLGSATLPVDLVRRVLETFTGNDVGLLGRSERVGLCDAPIVTAAAVVTSAHDLADAPVDDWVDAPIVAAALAAAEYTAASGAALLDAVAVGTEVGLRVELTVWRNLASPGWQPGAVAGRLGAAAATARLLGLDEHETVSALGLAATQVAGFAVTAATPAGPVTIGKAAGDGIEAAVLAHAGFRGPAAPIEGRRGLAAVLSAGAADPAPMTDALGDRWFTADLPGTAEFANTLPCAGTVAVALDVAARDGVVDLLTASRQEGAFR